MFIEGCEGLRECLFLIFILMPNLPCLLRLLSMFVALPDRLSMELECVHWDRRDWGWVGSFRDRPPTSMQLTFMFGLSPAFEKCNNSVKNGKSVNTIQCKFLLCPLHTERVGTVGIGRRGRLFGVQCVSQARSLVGAREGVQWWFAGAWASRRASWGVQTSRGWGGRVGGMRRKLLLLH